MAITWSATSAASASTSARSARSPAASIATRRGRGRWTHVGTICTHCADGCKTTLGVRNDKIIRGNNRDRSGINGEFLCIKGRYAFDFYDHAGAPAGAAGAREWQARGGLLVEGARRRGREVQRDARRAAAGSASSARTTPPTKRITTCRSSRAEVLGTNNIDHHRTGDVATLLDALSGKTGAAGDRRATCTTARPSWWSARDLALRASVPLLPDSRELPASPGARLRGDARAGARRQVRRRAACACRAGRGIGRASNRCATS